MINDSFNFKFGRYTLVHFSQNETYHKSIFQEAFKKIAVRILRDYYQFSIRRVDFRIIGNQNRTPVCTLQRSDERVKFQMIELTHNDR